jgi:hypothetical protein
MEKPRKEEGGVQRHRKKLVRAKDMLITLIGLIASWVPMHVKMYHL